MPTALRWMDAQDFQAKLAKSVRPLNAAVRKAAAPEIEAADDQTRTIKFVLSDSGVDRDKDTVSAKGWSLDNYKKNPVVLWAHDYEQLPIGRAVHVGVEDGKLKATAEFMPAELNPMADTIYRMLKGGWLKGNSVGFKPVDYDYNAERKGVDYHAQELLEFSIVPIPSNPGALAEAKAAGVDVEVVQKWATAVLKAMGTCPECGAKVPANAKECPQCGADVMQKAPRSAASTNDLPDSCFAYIEPGGSKDAGGKTTPRSLRHLPYKHADGSVDLPHLRNALARLDQTDIPDAAKASARKRLEAAAADAGVGDHGPAKAAANNTGGGSEGTGAYGDGAADTHEQGRGDPQRDTDGCVNGTACPKMLNQACPMAGGCPMGKTQEPAVVKRGRMLSASNEAGLRSAIANIQAILDKLSPDQAQEALDQVETAEKVPQMIVRRGTDFCLTTLDGTVLSTHPSLEAAVTALHAEPGVAKAVTEMVDEFLLEIADAAEEDGLDFGELTPDDVAHVIKGAVKQLTQEALAARDATRRGRVD